jgi:hypothetical protein
LNPAKVTADDELEFYGDARGCIQAIIILLVDYFSTAAISDIEDYRKYLLEHADENGRTEIAKYDEEQILNRVMDKFAKSGAVIMMDATGKEMALGEKSKQTSIEKSDAVSVDNTPEADFEPEPDPESKETDNSEDWAPQKEKAKDPYGQPEAEDGEAEPVSKNLEYSDAAEGPKEETDNLDDIPEEDFV